MLPVGPRKFFALVDSVTQPRRTQNTITVQRNVDDCASKSVGLERADVLLTWFNGGVMCGGQHMQQVQYLVDERPR